MLCMVLRLPWAHIVWSHALNKAVNMCFICRNNSKRMDLKKILLEKPGWIVLSGATNVQCHCCVTINSTARCANPWLREAETGSITAQRKILHVNQWRSHYKVTWVSLINKYPSSIMEYFSYSPFYVDHFPSATCTGQNAVCRILTNNAAFVNVNCNDFRMMWTS